MKTLADRAKFAREKLGLSQPQVAQRVSKIFRRKVSQQSIGNVESGKTQNPHFFNELAIVLQVNPLWLRTGEGSREPGEVYEIREPGTSYAAPVKLEVLANILREMDAWAKRAHMDPLSPSQRAILLKRALEAAVAEESPNYQQHFDNVIEMAQHWHSR